MLNPSDVYAKSKKTYVVSSITSYNDANSADNINDAKWEVSYTRTYKYNKAGYRTLNVYERSRGTTETSYEYKNKKLTKVVTKTDGEVDFYTNYTYNKSGKLSQVVSYGPSDELWNTTDYVYENNKLSQTVEKNSQGQIIEEDTFYSNGNMKTELDYEDGVLEMQFEYDKHGNVTKFQAYEDDGTTLETLSEYTYKYDKNKVKRVVEVETQYDGAETIITKSEKSYYTSGYKKGFAKSYKFYEYDEATATYNLIDNYEYTYKKDKKSGKVASYTTYDTIEKKNVGKVKYKYKKVKTNKYTDEYSES